MLGAYLTYGEQYKDKLNAKLNFFNPFFFFCHAKTIQVMIVELIFNIYQKQLILDTATRNYSIPSSYAKNLLDSIYKIYFLLCKYNLLLNFCFGLNHCKCKGHTSNKVDKISSDIIPTMIDFENLKINYSHYSRSSLFEP